MRILVTGSRDWPESSRHVINAALKERIIPGDTVVVHGACLRGADEFASQYCIKHGVSQELHPADWEQYGRSAGPRRNAEMVNLGADLCLAFIYQNSRGASHTVSLCRNASIPLEIFRLF